ncbi:MAG: hypothetical protein ABWZ02_10320, partial [Nakamurella sp.]
ADRSSEVELDAGARVGWPPIGAAPRSSEFVEPVTGRAAGAGPDRSSDVDDPLAGADRGAGVGPDRSSEVDEPVAGLGRLAGGG